jgi:predicted NAD/FAD-binding protein
LGSYDYDHPVFDLPAIAAQSELPRLQGQQRTWYAGAWMRYGFHEDGYQAGLAAAQGLLAQQTHMQEALA